MVLGIYSKTYQGNIEEIFTKMASQQIYNCHLNLMSADMPMMPEIIDYAKLDNILNSATLNGIKLIGLSATFNMIDFKTNRLKENIKKFDTLCQIANYLKIDFISLCTGSKHPTNQWAWDPLNDTAESLNEFKETLNKLLIYTHKYNIVLGIEPESNNVINSAYKAKEIIDYFDNCHLKIILDPVNLIEASNINDQRKIIKKSFELLGNHLAVAHAKNYILQDNNLVFVAPHLGSLDYNLVLQLLKQYNYKGPFVMHALKETDVEPSIQYLKEKINAVL